MVTQTRTVELAQDIPGFSRTDRMGLTVFGSVLIHMLIILGIGFTVPKILPKLDPFPTLEITLVNTRSDTAPEKADFLAQANQEGGGDSEKPVIARSPLPITTLPLPSESVAKASIRSEPRKPKPAPKPEVITTSQPDPAKLKPDSPREPRPKVEESNPGLARKAQQLQERTRLSAEISRFWEEYQKRPRRKFLSARTREHRFAAYLEAWRQKVERVGNLNYPEQAKRRKLTGQLVMDVEINPDGSVHAVNVIRASGNKILDDAATRIVRLAAPFSPFPDSFRREVDILHITRTWQFLHGNRLTSR